MELKLTKSHYLLFMVFLLVLALRIYFAFQTPYLSSNDDYFTSRQVEHIKDTGLPITYDSLSFGGRAYTGTPVFYYILAFFNIFIPLEIVGKVIINIFASLLVIVIYFIAYKLTKSRAASLFSSFISGFIPVFFNTTFNSLSIYSIAFPLLFFCIYCFLRIDEPNYLFMYLLGLFLLTLISPVVLLLVIGFVFYALLLKLDRMNQNRGEVEVMLFSIFFVIWFLFIAYKKAFLLQGYSLIWQNIPLEILKNYFENLTILGVIYQIGSLPLLYSIYAVLHHIYKPEHRTSCLFSSFALSVVILLWARLIEPYIGLICLGIISVLLFAKFYTWSFDYWKHTRFAKFKNLLYIIIIIPLVLTSILPSLLYAENSVKGTISNEEVAVLKWISLNTDENSTILAPLSEGHLITGIAKRKNIADDNFLLVRDADQRYSDMNRVYNAKFETEAIKLLNKYDVSYILITPKAKKEFEIDELEYAKDSKCFELIYINTTKVYKAKCNLKTL